jgi:hypothetical protein
MEDSPLLEAQKLGGVNYRNQRLGGSQFFVPTEKSQTVYDVRDSITLFGSPKRQETKSYQQLTSHVFLPIEEEDGQEEGEVLLRESRQRHKYQPFDVDEFEEVQDG